MFDIENEGQSDGAHHPQWCDSMEIMKFYKRRHYVFFAAALTISEIIPFQIR